jgi:hypothetical protein
VDNKACSRCKVFKMLLFDLFFRGREKVVANCDYSLSIWSNLEETEFRVNIKPGC